MGEGGRHRKSDEKEIAANHGDLYKLLLTIPANDDVTVKQAPKIRNVHPVSEVVASAASFRCGDNMERTRPLPRKQAELQTKGR